MCLKFEMKNLKVNINILESYLCFRADWCTPLQHHVDDLFVTRTGRAVKWRQTVPSFGFDVGTFLKKQGYHVGFTPFGCHM